MRRISAGSIRRSCQGFGFSDRAIASACDIIGVSISIAFLQRYSDRVIVG